MSKRSNLYTGRAGHLAVMAELLLQGWNTAIPEVDVGDDIFVVHDRNGDLHRVQVKTAVAKRHKYGYSAQFNLSLSQLQMPLDDMTYIFAIRLQDDWKAFVVIERKKIEEYREDGMGSENRGRLILRLRFKGKCITCHDHDLSKYRNAWDRILVKKESLRLF